MSPSSWSPHRFSTGAPRARRLERPLQCPIIHICASLPRACLPAAHGRTPTPTRGVGPTIPTRRSPVPWSLCSPCSGMDHVESAPGAGARTEGRRGPAAATPQTFRLARRPHSTLMPSRINRISCPARELLRSRARTRTASKLEPGFCRRSMPRMLRFRLRCAQRSVDDGIRRRPRRQLGAGAWDPRSAESQS